jgi:hypothetical protein
MSAQAVVICSDSAVDFNVGIERQLDSFRAARREIEASVLPLATSVDGRRFTFQASLYPQRLPGRAAGPSRRPRHRPRHPHRRRGPQVRALLLVSTQRPQKIPENVLSQADNLVLLRLNSLADAAFAQAVFSFVPPSLIQRSATFRPGEGLIAGKISPEPALLRFGARISEEGGADVPATWASPR